MADVMSNRMGSAQTMLRILKDDTPVEPLPSKSPSTSKPPSSSYLLQSLGLGSPAETAQSDTLNAHTETQQHTETEAKADVEKQEEQVSTGIGSASFMTALKVRLMEMKTTPDGKQRAREMLEALQAGTLTVIDAENRQIIKAWDVAAESGSGARSKPTDNIGAAGWSDFLKERLTRGGNATYLMGANGAYIDNVTGESAYFGTIGETYAYLSWPARTSV